MSAADHQRCRELLRLVRGVAASRHIEVNKLRPESFCKPIGAFRLFQVWTWAERTTGNAPLWRGYACCGWHAKARAVEQLILRRLDR
jgi:hypothetical protein